MRTNAITNSEDILDSRTIIARIEELEELMNCVNCLGEGNADGTAHAVEPVNEEGEPLVCVGWESQADDDEREELVMLTAFMDDLKGNGGDEQWRGDWYPVTLVRDSYWEDYAREEAEDMYGKELEGSYWPFTCIDWERAARELQMDYSSAEFDCVTYWYR